MASDPADERWARIEALFHDALGLPASEREARVREWSAGDEVLRQDVMSLLGASRGPGGFLTTPAIDVPGLFDGMVAASESEADALLGQRIGEYLVKSRIGTGGMGVVYLAQQDNPAREVALKLMRPGVMSPTLVRRFEHEAQILGRLQHPGIAQIYGAGRIRSATGTQPYFAMEYVRGKSLRSMGTSTLPERVAIMALVCDAVQHAHAKGVVHRDLKPANILVVEADATLTGTSGGTSPGSVAYPRLQPKVLDFGVARVTEADVHLTAQTNVGEVIGTLAYMSPEQVNGRPDEVDTRSDVYALGVVLFELLTGRLPIELAGLSIAQAAPMIAEQEPLRLGSVAPSLRGDLEVIVSKALEKDRSRRYQSAGELGEDLRRFLANAPILARPPTTMYQLRKFAQRNRALVGGMISAVVLLIGGVVGTSIGLVRARQSLTLAERREIEANAAAAEAERTVEFLTSMLSSANPVVTRGRELTVRELVDEAAARVGYELQSQPRVECRTRLTLSQTYLSLGADEAAATQADRATELAQRLSGKDSLEYADALLAKGMAMGRQVSSDAPLELYREVIKIRTRALGERSGAVGRARSALAMGFVNATRYAEAKREFEAAGGILREAGDPGLVSCLTSHAEFLMKLPGKDRLAEAEALLGPAIEEARAGGVKAEPSLASLLSALGAVHVRSRRFTEAEPALREAIRIRDGIFPAGHPSTFSPRIRLVTVLRGLKRPADARSEGESLLKRLREVMGPKSKDLPNLCVQVGQACHELGDYPAAAGYFVEAAHSCKLLQDTVLTEVYLILAADSWLDAEDDAMAEPLLREVLTMISRSPTGLATFVSLSIKLAGVLERKGEHAERLVILREARARANDGVILDVIRAGLCDALAEALLDAKGDPAEREALLCESLGLWKALDASADEAVWAAYTLAAFLDDAGRGEESGRIRAEFPTPPKGPRRLLRDHHVPNWRE